MKGLVSQYSMKNDQYPKTMTDAIDVMSKHLFDDAYYDRIKRARERNKRNNDNDDEKVLSQTKEGYRCYVCGSPSHPLSE